MIRKISAKQIVSLYKSTIYSNYLKAMNHKRGLTDRSQYLKIINKFKHKNCQGVKFGNFVISFFTIFIFSLQFVLKFVKISIKPNI